MTIRYSIWSLVLIFLVLLGTGVEASRTPRDSSGDPMQRFNSQMMSSPMIRFPAVLGLSLWPYINYPPAPSMTITNVQVQVPSTEQGPTATPAPPAHPKFWIAHCGGFVELEANSTMSVIDEEQKPCSP
jgi:hypothetical protein